MLLRLLLNASLLFAVLCLIDGADLEEEYKANFQKVYGRMEQAWTNVTAAESNVYAQKSAITEISNAIDVLINERGESFMESMQQIIVGMDDRQQELEKIVTLLKDHIEFHEKILSEIIDLAHSSRDTVANTILEKEFDLYSLTRRVYVQNGELLVQGKLIYDPVTFARSRNAIQDVLDIGNNTLLYLETVRQIEQPVGLIEELHSHLATFNKTFYETKEAKTHLDLMQWFVEKYNGSTSLTLSAGLIGLLSLLYVLFQH